MNNGVRIFIFTVKHYHTDDCHHDPKLDVRIERIIHKSEQESHDLIRARYGSAWKIQLHHTIDIEAGVMIP